MKREASKITAQWEVQLNCYCPNCNSFVDLLEAPDFWDGRGWLDIPQHNTEETDNLEVSCPECEHYFEVCCE